MSSVPKRWMRIKRPMTKTGKKEQGNSAWRLETGRGLRTGKGGQGEKECLPPEGAIRPLWPGPSSVDCSGVATSSVTLCWVLR